MSGQVSFRGSTKHFPKSPSLPHQGDQHVLVIKALDLKESHCWGRKSKTERCGAKPQAMPGQDPELFKEMPHTGH